MLFATSDVHSLAVESVAPNITIALVGGQLGPGKGKKSNPKSEKTRMRLTDR